MPQYYPWYLGLERLYWVNILLFIQFLRTYLSEAWLPQSPHPSCEILQDIWPARWLEIARGWITFGLMTKYGCSYVNKYIGLTESLLLKHAKASYRINEIMRASNLNNVLDLVTSEPALQKSRRWRDLEYWMSLKILLTLQGNHDTD